SQAILLESFPREKRGVAMAVFALGVIVAPIIGPTVGGWITDNYSWRWIFLINLPVGILAVIFSRIFIEDPPYIRKNRASRIDYVGFSLMALGLGLLQVVLDKGQEVDWFSAPWICWSSAVVVTSLTAFVVWELKTKDPVVNFHVTRDINFSIGTLIVTIIGAVLYSTTALLPIFLQTLMGYTAYLSGLAISPRGIGAFLTALIVGRIIGKTDARLLVAGGLTLLGITCYNLGDINLQIGIMNIIWPIIGTGIGLSCIFVPLTTLTMGTLPKEDMGNATGLFNLMRNIGGSIGIALTTTFLARLSQVHQNILVSHLTPYDLNYQQALRTVQNVLSGAGATGFLGLRPYEMIYQELLRQASLMAFVDNFRWLGILCVLCVPAIFLFRKVDFGKNAAVAAH
ncbi:MAG TPA: DHA2 family efflux MFS transporter permease subunit, partial [Candidatus Omnitrophota bacterium]|nr:DHA2 family efflux MFS transporter permease subunit [Candidatus Omnitrophota bacterium]